jgi:hypothetical protein
MEYGVWSSSPMAMIGDGDKAARNMCQRALVFLSFAHLFFLKDEPTSFCKPWQEVADTAINFSNVYEKIPRRRSRRA